ncbi:MAG TPA: hypothetical protein VIB38_09100 [Aestuariivirgaceae bacterium]|jgi:hypothetical protein
MFFEPDRPAQAWINSVTVTCPDRLSKDPAIIDIRDRGNLPLIVGDQVLAEVTRHDLVESWETACALPVKELAKMCKIAGERLARAMEESIEAADLSEVVTDAAVLFLLGIRRHGIRTPDDIPACSVSYDLARGEEMVALSA